MPFDTLAPSVTYRLPTAYKGGGQPTTEMVEDLPVNTFLPIVLSLD